MGSSKTTNTYNRQNWEDSDFPTLCETCLGDNPMLRMMKERHGKECKICSRPFTVFRWCPGVNARFKKTEVCQTCAKVKNVCQTCILDLEYGLPVEVRDKAIRQAQALPKSDVNREYFLQQASRELDQVNSEGSGNVVPYGQLGKAQPVSDMLMKLARTTPYYRRNRPHICSFWVKGLCKRGEECPYRHEKPTDPDDPLSNQNIKDRYYGEADPVADKLLKKYDTMPQLEAPEDKTVTTLYVGGLMENMDEALLRGYFYQFGEIRSVSVHQKQRCAFVQFTTREAAEKAAEKSFDKLILLGKRLTIKWGKSQALQQLPGTSTQGAAALPPVPGLPGALPFPPPNMFAPHTSIGPPMPPHGPPPPMPPPPPGLTLPPPPPLPMFVRPPMGMEPPPPGTGPAARKPMMIRPPGIPPNIPPPGLPPAIHYPSQDPNRLGSFTAPHLRKPNE